MLTHMLSNYQRYLASHFIPPFFMTLFFSLAFLLTFQLFRIIRFIIGKGVSLGVFFGLIVDMAVSFLPMAIPLSAMIATIYSLNRLGEDSEIVAMRSFGIDKKQLFTPFFILAMGISLSIWSLGRNIIPHSKTQFKNTIISLTSKERLRDIQAEHFFTEIPNITLFVQKTDGENGEMEDIFIHSLNSKEDKEKVIFAKRGFFIKDENSPLRLHLISGNIIDISMKTNEMKKILFKNYDFPILHNIKSGLVAKDSMLTNKELSLAITKREKELTQFESDEGKRAEINQGLLHSKLEYWSRFNNPLQCLIFVFLGFCLGIKKGREKTKNTNVVAMCLLVSYYVIFFMGVGLSRKGVIPPIITIFLPTIIMAEIGRRFYQKLDWTSRSTAKSI